ncbi:MAG: cytochrome P460 family protein [Candidatus Electrothrix scaldis]|nr:MAG: cytochrome P460 family protein [Candidatus Electrothrix sp. GW3-3]
MSKKKISVCFLSVVMLGNVLAAQGEETVEMPKPEGEAVWKYISQENPFNEWTIWEDHQGTDGPDSSFSPNHKLYVNKQAVDSKSAPLNNESMAVSYIRSPADEPQAIVVMYKVKGYNPTAGDWFWARYSLTGEVEDAGKIPRCIACHTKKAADNDYIITHKFDK